MFTDVINIINYIKEYAPNSSAVVGMVTVPEFINDMGGIVIATGLGKPKMEEHEVSHEHR